MQTSIIRANVERGTAQAVVSYTLENAHFAEGAYTLGSYSFDELFDFVGLPPSSPLRSIAWNPRSLYLQPGGWQSWSAGWELAWNESLPRRVLVVPQLIKYTNRDGDNPLPGEIVGHFISYLRVGDEYLCLASLEGGVLPPVAYRFDRRARRVVLESFGGGRKWKKGEKVAEVRIFSVSGVFALKDALKAIYRPEERFSRLSFLKTESDPQLRPGGFESWYNHYNDIDEALIRDDLEALDKTDNLINALYKRRGRPTVFQIDDGWQNCVGEWEINAARFPGGLRSLSDAIEAKGMIPGLWFAPFLVTRSAAVFRERPDWLLRDATGNLVVAGFNDKWDNDFYCLDLSRRDVLAYLRRMMDRAIDDWGIRYLKLDFLYAGLFSGAHGEPGSPFECYDRAVRTLTERTADKEGRPVAYLGCGVPLGPSFPYFPLSRIGADTKEDWEWPKLKLIGHVGRPSAYINLLDTIGRSYLDGTVYVNDPDVVFLRDRNCRLRENEKELIALVNYLLASQIMFSDDPVDFGHSPDERRLTERVVSLYDQIPADEYGATRIARNVFRLESRSGKIAGLINLGSRRYRLRHSKEKGLFDDLARGNPLVDHRLPFGSIAAALRRDGLYFAPRSITLVRV